MRRITLGLFLLAIIGTGFLFYFKIKSKPIVPEVIPVRVTHPVRTVLGTSVQGRNIEAYTYPTVATSTKNVVFVGGIHGGYEWNSVLLAYELMDYLESGTSTIPINLKVTVIPSLNPDGVYKIVGKSGRFKIADVPKGTNTVGRFNANQVDLNRNFDYKWQPKSTWQSKSVSAGSKAFSEPEAQAFRNFILKEKPDAVVFWHSASNAVYASQCEKGILPETINIMNAYAKASGYPAVKTFDAYPVTGAAEDWLASIGIPSITVELKTHDSVEFTPNLSGIKAIFEYYSD